MRIMFYYLSSLAKQCSGFRFSSSNQFRALIFFKSDLFRLAVLIPESFSIVITCHLWRIVHSSPLTAACHFNSYLSSSCFSCVCDANIHDRLSFLPLQVESLHCKMFHKALNALQPVEAPPRHCSAPTTAWFKHANEISINIWMQRLHVKRPGKCKRVLIKWRSDCQQRIRMFRCPC